MRGILSVFAVLTLLTLATPSRACPLCKDAIGSSQENEEYRDDPFLEARAYNYSIYMMVGMPYLLLTVLGILIYRNYRTPSVPPVEQGDSSCPPTSPGGPS